MATVNASKYGYGYATSELGWMTARDATTANAVTNQPSSTNLRIVRVNYEAGGKGSEWGVYRAWFAFNVSAYSSHTISNLKLYYKPTTSTSGHSGAGLKVAIVKSTAQGNADTDLTTSDFNNFDDTVDYADNDGTNIWADSTSLSYFDLNSTAISAFTSSYLKVCIMEYVYDYPDTAPTVSGTDVYAYCNFGTVPYLSFTAVAPGYGNDIIGVSSSDISKVIGVATADISKVIGA